MSILLTILLVLATFHFFYQAVVVKANHQLLQDELKYQQLMLEAYFKREKANLAPIEIQFIKEFQAHQNHFVHVVTEVNLLDYVLFSIRESKKNSPDKKRIDSSLVRKDLQAFEKESMDVLTRSMFINSLLFVLLLSPVIILLKFVATLQNKKFTFDKLHAFSDKHC